MTALPHPDCLHDDPGRANRVAARKHLNAMKLENPERLDGLQRDWDDAAGCNGFHDIQRRRASDETPALSEGEHDRG